MYLLILTQDQWGKEEKEKEKRGRRKKDLGMEREREKVSQEGREGIIKDG